MTEQPAHSPTTPTPGDDESDPTLRVREQTANDLGSIDAFGDDKEDCDTG